MISKTDLIRIELTPTLVVSVKYTFCKGIKGTKNEIGVPEDIDDPDEVIIEDIVPIIGNTMDLFNWCNDQLEFNCERQIRLKKENKPLKYVNLYEMLEVKIYSLL